MSRSQSIARTRRSPRSLGVTAQALTEALESRWLLYGGVDKLVNNNNGATGTGFFTQSETTVIAYGNNVVIGFNDSGSNAAGGTGPGEGDGGGGSAGFTGWSRSVDGGNTWIDGGGMPEGVGGNAGDPVLARNNTTGRVYHATLGFTTSTIRVFRSDDNAVSWQPAITGTPGGASEDKQWMAVDNNAGANNGNVYLISRRFGGTTGMYFHRSIDHGATFSTGLQLWPAGAGVQGGYVTVGLDHAVYAFAFTSNSLYQMRKSTDGGLTFSAAASITPAYGGAVNGDLGLTGMRNGTATFNAFRSNGFAHFAVNPVSGHLYGVYAANPVGTDKGDIQMIMSTNGGASWSAPVKVNDDPTLTDQWQPTLAVTPDGTKLGIFYYSREGDTANNNLFRYWGRIGTIAGGAVNFTTPSEAISDVASQPEFGRDSLVNTVYMGDYDSATATNDAFHVVWSDSRSVLPNGGVRMDPNVYYDKINVTPVQPNGIWTGLAGDFQWNTPGNWTNNVVPGPIDDVLIQTPGSFTVNVSNAVTTVNTLTLGNNSGSNPTLLIGANGNRVFVTDGLAINGSARFDLNDNDLIVDYSGPSQLGAVQTLINAGRTGGTWLGNGLTSTAARNANPKNTSLGAMESSDFKVIYGAGATFDGQTIDTTAVLVKYTYYGDADFNGQVNFDDYVRTDAGFNSNGTVWVRGDYDGDGQVNFDDYVLLDLAFNSQTAQL